MGYHLVMLAAAAVFTLQLQKMKKGRPASADKARQDVTLRATAGQR